MLKIEMLYSQEYRYYNLQELIKAIAEYIHYYNEERILGSTLKEIILIFFQAFGLVQYTILKT